ncbi:MAG: B-box zinc finger protein [Candidatus Hodarchaeales archaeon]
METVGVVMEFIYFVIINTIIITMGYDIYKEKKIIIEGPKCGKCGKKGAKMKCKGCNAPICRECKNEEGKCPKCEGIVFVKVGIQEYTMTRKGLIISIAGLVMMSLAILYDFRILYTYKLYSDITRIVVLVAGIFPVIVLVLRVVSWINRPIYLRMIKYLQQGEE